MLEYILIGAAAFFASVLTFFSGFGLGTLLSVVYLQFFPVKLAIAFTSIIHFLNNVVKFLLLRKEVDYGILLRFGITAFIGAFVGSQLLLRLPENELFSYSMFGSTYSVKGLNLLIGVLLIFFALAELLPLLHFKVSNKVLPIGGFLSGFFGGLSGHQGALRSSFLIKLGLTKEVFVGTGIAVSLIIDITRIGSYTALFNWNDVKMNGDYLLAALLPALVGALVGRQLLKKITYQMLQVIVATGIIIFALALSGGIISK